MIRSNKNLASNRVVRGRWRNFQWPNRKVLPALSELSPVKLIIYIILNSNPTVIGCIFFRLAPEYWANAAFPYFTHASNASPVRIFEKHNTDMWVSPVSILFCIFVTEITGTFWNWENLNKFFLKHILTPGNLNMLTK